MKQNKAESHPLYNLAHEVLRSRVDLVSHRFNQEIKLAMLDTWAVNLVAQTLPSVRRMISLTTRQSIGEGQVWWNGMRISPYDAAFVNSYAAHYLDFDSILFSTYGHPYVMLLPALMAMYDCHELRGQALLNAILVGCETMSLLGDTFGAKLVKRGLHPTSVLGSLSVTTAVAHLLGLSETQTESALSLSGATLSGFKSSFGLSAKPYQVATAVRQGITAARLAEMDPEPIWQHNWLDNLVVLSAVKQPNWMGRSFSSPSWVFDRHTTMFKFFPCCGYFHPVMYEVKGMLQLTKRSWKDLKEVRLLLPSFLMNASRYDRPTTEPESKFSLPFCLGLMIVYQDAQLEHFCEEQLQNSDLLRAMEMLHIETINNDACLGADGHLRGKAVICFRDGATVQDEVVVTASESLDIERIVQKFRSCAQGKLSKKQAEAFLDFVMNFEQTDSYDWKCLQQKLSLEWG